MKITGFENPLKYGATLTLCLILVGVGLGIGLQIMNFREGDRREAAEQRRHDALYKEAQLTREWASQCNVIHEAIQLKEELENARNSLQSHILPKSPSGNRGQDASDSSGP